MTLPTRLSAPVAAVAALLAGSVLAACTTVPSVPKGTVAVVAAENEYGSVATQIGGRYVHVVSVERNPNVDPHNYEASPSVASEVSAAGLVIQNGVGYDGWINTLESASPNDARRVITAQTLLGLPDSTPNPHLWYDPRTMPLVASAIANDLAALQPAHAAFFRGNARRFDATLTPWMHAIAAFRAHHAGTRAATTEPVADFLLEAMGITNMTPFVFQADVMNGTEPSPQDVALENGLFPSHAVKLFVFNEQVVDSLTGSIRSSAQASHVPIVGVYETMPPGYDYGRWMLAETQAIQAAVVEGTSTQHL